MKKLFKKLLVEEIKFNDSNNSRINLNFLKKTFNSEAIDQYKKLDNKLKNNKIKGAKDFPIWYSKDENYILAHQQHPANKWIGWRIVKYVNAKMVFTPTHAGKKTVWRSKEMPSDSILKKYNFI